MAVSVSVLRLVSVGAEELLPDEVTAFAQACIESPGDEATLGAFADWLDEQGDEALAFALRWMAAKGKYPANVQDRWPTESWPWRWSGHNANDRPDVLPHYVCRPGTPWDVEFEGKSWLAAVVHLAVKLAFLRAELVVSPTPSKGTK